jgi:hypothetical protein
MDQGGWVIVLDGSLLSSQNGGEDNQEVSVVSFISRATVTVGVVIVGAVALAMPAGAASKVGPHQFFAGVINGTDGNTSVPITIKMACFGPLRPGQTGHPLGGQTLAVHQLFPPTATDGSLGNTGDGSTIGVFFHAPPPSASPMTTTDSVSFTRYDKTKNLPTSVTLPCTGTGTVWFVPIPVVPPSQSEGVPVRFVSQP